MSLFRRPTEDSSDSEDSSECEEEPPTHQDATAPDGVLGIDLTATETLSSADSISLGEGQEEISVANADHHRNMMLASLLEDFYKTRALDVLNSATSGVAYHRQSPEVQALARSLFSQAGQDLARAGILPSETTASRLEGTRQQYISGFSNLGLQNLQDNDLLPATIRRRISADDQGLTIFKTSRTPDLQADTLLETPMRELALRHSNTGMIQHPFNDMRLSAHPTRASHYQSSFQETRLLGKGGFGRVYHTYNFFDKKEYAVKKIPLSPKLSQRYREKGHAELSNILREVQALAQLDHCNVVRYHATWIEEPTTTGELKTSDFQARQPNQKLLDIRPAFSTPPDSPSRADGRVSFDMTDGILFEADSRNPPVQDLGWSFQAPSRQVELSSFLGSEIFTDGVARRASQEQVVNDSDCYVLHVQMSMYPMTLTQYLSPLPSNSISSPSAPNRRHCYHLVPTLRIILGILYGLQYIHSKGLIHRDIKPSNVFLSTEESSQSKAMPDGWHDVGACPTCNLAQTYFVNPRIGDFGLVAVLAEGTERHAEGSSGSSEKAVGTQYYRPPMPNKDKEPWTSRRVNEQLDVFALGVVMVEMLCYCTTSMERLDLLKGLQDGRIPAHITRAIELEDHPAGTGKLVEELIKGMIDQDAETRWSCARVKAHVDTILQSCRCQSSRPNGKVIPIDTPR